MHEHLGSFKQNPSQKNCKNLIHFLKKPKIFQKHKKLGQKKMKCMINEWKRIIPK